MADQPDFTENTDISEALSPEDLADLEARMADIASKPLPTPEILASIQDLRAGSQGRIAEMIAGPGENIAFDLSTPQGHVDAVMYVRTCLLAIADQVADCTDPITVSDLFSEAHDMWDPLPGNVQFNVLLDFVFAFTALHRERHPEEHQ